jgi:ornithine cyclodeaminase/alanine dehydrogenase-like protein (mu-crystallin family)
MSAPPDAATRMRSLILTRTDIADLMRPADWLAAAETAFRAAGEGRADAPPPLAIPGAQGVFHAKGAGLRGARSHVALKLNANFPGNPQQHGLPTIQGAILLCDGGNGAVLAIMDSIEVTLRRTAAATALAARYLARTDAANILICGCGAQGAAQLEALREVLPLTHCFAWDRDPERAAAFAERFQAEVSADLATSAPASDIIVTCTTSRQPFLDLGMVRAGTFVAAVGADSPEKSEIAPALMAGGKVVADVLDQCIAMGDLHHAIAAGAMTPGAVHAELAALVGGARPGRTSAEEITLFDSTGTGLQDVAAAAMIYERALAAGDWLSVALAA